MGIRLLGPVELRTGSGGFVSPSGPQRRAVLALLALRLGRVVAVDAFCGLLWGERSPATARAALQGHVAALRKLLGGTPFALHTRAPGYVLSGPADGVDALRFESLTAAAAECAGHDDRDGDVRAIGLLEEALGLWAGAALADLPDTGMRHDLAAGLDGARVSAQLAWAGLRLRRGTGAAAVPVLEQCVRAEGVREEAVALLMRCLHQAGRPADASAAYHRARGLLALELGVAPGPDLRAALAEVSAGGAPTDGAGAPGRSAAGRSAAGRPAPGSAGPPVPCMLPPRPTGFVGRKDERARLERECGPDGDGGPALVVGPAGVGKSVMVVHWAHGAAERFTGGRLFADMRGFDPAGEADPADVLGRFLLALGVPQAAVPADREGRAALYRARTADRRLLVVLDNARSADRVLDLLPAGPDCTTVVTSRSTLEELVVSEGAVLLRVEALTEDEALRLLETVLAPARVRAEGDAARRLVRLCDGLPLALRIAADRLAAEPDRTIAGLADELADEHTRLTALDGDGAGGVRAALVLTYRHLSAGAGRLLAGLGVHPGREVDTPAAAALLGSDLGTARVALGELAAHHLLAESAPGRYRRDDLVRLFGADLPAGDPTGFGRFCRGRLLDHYAEAARHFGEQLEPGLPGQDGRARPPAALPSAPDTRAALAWFRTEEPTIRALVAVAADADPERARRLAVLASPLYRGSDRLTEWLDCLRAGEGAAEACGDRVALALLRCDLGEVLLGLEREREALLAARQAVAGTAPADGAVHGRALAALALATAPTGDPDGARRTAAAAVAAAAACGDTRHLAHVLGTAAAVALTTGHPEEALRRAREVEALLPGHPTATVRVRSMRTEADALQALGRHEAGELARHRLLAACEEAGFSVPPHRR
ncbi:AfsR/SARP family transcriptional regulator [Kitasatospora sp. KL5]|uniref:AfsR/SARP family transcriptional regulator n=1 Tax=Kitasatospora sp. KL5 TaxID=3425125 RepID=UPI003D6F6A24